MNKNSQTPRIAATKIIKKINQRVDTSRTDVEDEMERQTDRQTCGKTDRQTDRAVKWFLVIIQVGGGGEQKERSKSCALPSGFPKLLHWE